MKFEENPYHRIEPFEQVDQIEKHLTIERNDSDVKFIFRPPDENPNILDENSCLGKKYKIDKEMLKEVHPKQVKDAKDSGKKAKKGSKKVPSKLHKAKLASL